MNLTLCHVIGERKGGQAREREKNREKVSTIMKQKFFMFPVNYWIGSTQLMLHPKRKTMKYCSFNYIKNDEISQKYKCPKSSSRHTKKEKKQRKINSRQERKKE